MSSTTDNSRDLVAYDRDVSELERRIELLEGLDESIPGQFTGWDWGVCVLVALLLPGLALWWVWRIAG